MLVALLLQVPPVVASLSAVVAPTHTLAVPVIGATPAEASLIVTELALDISFAVVPVLFTAFIMPLRITDPVPAIGAVHGISFE
jgi:hypothetical protein